LDELTVVPERVLTVLGDFLSAGRDGRWLIVAGDYGTGKTHSLSLIRELGLRSGFATCYLSADGYGSTLNQPQRFLHALLSTLESPGHRGRRYEDLIHGILLDPNGVGTLRDIVGPHLVTGREIDREVNLHIELLAAAAGRPGAHDRSASSRERISYHLCGHSIAHRAGPDVRTMAYVLIRIAQDMMVRTGARGLLVLIDEVESIYTKLSVQSRPGAYRVLAALCESRFLRACSVALAMTPDACRELSAAIPGMLSDAVASPYEPVPSLARALAAGSILTLQCQPLTPEIRVQLLERVRNLYRRAYPGALDLDRFEENWSAHVERWAAREVPVRLLVRQAVDVLDRARYRFSAD
jgi:hypothetical protein